MQQGDIQVTAHLRKVVVNIDKIVHHPLWLREYANATGRTLHLAAEEGAVTLGPVR